MADQVTEDVDDSVRCGRIFDDLGKAVMLLDALQGTALTTGDLHGRIRNVKVGPAICAL
jgi:hypothetical protein